VGFFVSLYRGGNGEAGFGGGGVTRAPEVYTPAVRRAAEEGSLGSGKRQRPDMIDVFLFFSSWLVVWLPEVFFFWCSVKVCQTSLAMMVGCCQEGKLGMTVKPASARLG